MSKDLSNKPIREFVTFAEAQEILGKKHRGSVENLIKNGSLRFHLVSKGSRGPARMFLKAEVLELKQQQKKGKSGTK